MPSRWSLRVEPITGLVPCNDEQHRVTWRRGKLVLEDHDLGAERAMIALGDPPCFCMRVLKLWRDQWTMPPDLFRQMEARLGALAVPELAPVRELAMVRNWERAWHRSSYQSKHGALLAEPLRARAVPALRRHLGLWAERLGCRVVSAAEVRLLPRRDSPSLTGTMDAVGARAAARLGATWLLDVWAAGLATVDDGFVLEVVDESGHPTALDVRAARWKRQPDGHCTPETAAARVRRADDGRWALEWYDDRAVT